MVDLSKFTYNKKILSKVVAKATNLLNKINITTYFENLIVELYVLYACWGPFVESPMERKAQWWGPQEIDYE